MILAGGKLDADLQQLTGLTWRADLPFKGRPFVDIVVDAIRPVGDVVVIGGPERTDVEWRPGGERFFDSFVRGIDAGGEGQFLMASADLPFLTQASVEDFHSKCQDIKAAVIYSIVNVTEMDRVYPGMARTTMRLKEGTFTGGNLFCVNGTTMREVMPRMQAAYEARKNVVQLGRLLGAPTLLAILLAKVAPGLVSIGTLERRVGQSLGAPVKALISEFPEIAADIDSSDHFAWLQSL